jgi:hypothetical protein
MESEMGLDNLFEILKNQRRRYVLQYLQEIDQQATLSDLAEQIAAWENNTELRRITSDERKRVYVGLYQVHLPKMDDRGVVSFNKHRGIIEPGENIDQCYGYLKPDSRRDDRAWSRYYVGLSGASMALLAGAALLETVVSVPAIATGAVLSLLGFVAVTASFAWVKRGNEDTYRSH